MSKRNKLFMTEFEAMAVDIVSSRGDVTNAEFARIVWPRSKQSASHFSFPAVKGAVALGRVAKKGYVIRRGFRWLASELGILSLANYIAEYGDGFSPRKYSGYGKRKL